MPWFRTLLKSRRWCKLSMPHWTRRLVVVTQLLDSSRLGWGGISYIRKILDYEEKIALGRTELMDPLAMRMKCIRRSGGGRKSAFEQNLELDKELLNVLSLPTLGSPMDETGNGLISPALKLQYFFKERGYKVSVTVVSNCGPIAGTPWRLSRFCECGHIMNRSLKDRSPLQNPNCLFNSQFLIPPSLSVHSK